MCLEDLHRSKIAKKQSASGGFGMTKNNVIYDEEDLEMLEGLKYCIATCGEFYFEYRGREYKIGYEQGKLCGYLVEPNTPEYPFKDFDDIMENYIIEGKPFKDIVHDIEGYGLL